jgi:parallel beta-helix repeat protein
LIVAPGETIQAAIDAALVGDTVFVDPGTYTENIRLRTGVDVVGSGYSSTTLRGLGNSNVVTAIGVSDARMEGFKITRSGTESHAGVNIIGGSVQMNNNWIIGNQIGVRIMSGSSAIIRNNIVEGNGSAANAVLDYGILCLSSTPLIANNVVTSNTGAGLYFAWAASTGAQVINNTVVDNNDQGIWCYNGANITIKNNIFKGNSTGISASHGSLPLISFNDVWGNRWLNYDSQSGGVAAPGPGDISADPLFNTSSSPPFALALGSPCINAGDPNPIYSDLDGTRNDMGAFGGPSGLLGGIGSAVTSGFLFNNIGKIPTSEITPTGPSAGLANVTTPVANALHIYQYKDAPFGGNLWLHGLFGSTDNSVRYYRIYAAPWSGGTPPVLADFTQVTDPLSKIKYTIGPGGLVTATLENIGPDSNGMYLRTESGYWAHPDLKMIWNTLALPNGCYDLICKAYNVFLLEVPLPANSLSRITVHVNNQPVTATINAVRNQLGIDIPECGLVPLASNTENLQFDITASHPGGFLRDFTLDVLYGRNRYGGVIAADRYAGVHDTTPPVWAGVTAVVSNSAPAHASGALLPWTSCAYQFRLTAWARTTDGFNHLYYQQFNDHYSLNVGQLVPSACVADLDGDGDVDGADLAIFAAQFGRTDCITIVSP